MRKLIIILSAVLMFGGCIKIGLHSSISHRVKCLDYDGYLDEKREPVCTVTTWLYVDNFLGLGISPEKYRSSMLVDKSNVERVKKGHIKSLESDKKRLDNILRGN